MQDKYNFTDIEKNGRNTGKIIKALKLSRIKTRRSFMIW